MQGKSDNLEAFAKRIIERLNQSEEGTGALERIVCRMITGNNPKVASFMANKLVEWRYGKAKETLRIEEHEAFDSGTDFFGTADTASVCEPN